MAVVEKVRTLQQGGVPCGWTMDAGPNVKVLCESANAEQVEASLGALPGVSRTLVCRPGGGVSVDVEQSPS